MIGIVDYGLGNIRAFVNIYRQLNLDVMVCDTAQALARADRLILPGVGSFDWAMTTLDRSGMRTMLDRRVMEDKVPILGVCVGMQMMAKHSEEGAQPGLGWLDAAVVGFRAGANRRLRLPHMGWNDVLPVAPGGLFAGLAGIQCYFLHSYYFVPLKEGITLARTDYAGEFACAVGEKNMFGTQFHPEKSHGSGIGILRNFATQ